MFFFGVTLSSASSTHPQPEPLLAASNASEKAFLLAKRDRFDLLKLLLWEAMLLLFLGVVLLFLFLGVLVREEGSWWLLVNL